MKEFLWIAAVRLLSVVSLTIRLSLEAGDILKAMFGFGQAGRKHPNGEFPFIHRQSFSGVVRSCGLLIQRIHSGAISARPILGLVKRLVGQL